MGKGRIAGLAGVCAAGLSAAALYLAGPAQADGQTVVGTVSPGGLSVSGGPLHPGDSIAFRFGSWTTNGLDLNKNVTKVTVTVTTSAGSSSRTLLPGGGTSAPVGLPAAESVSVRWTATNVFSNSVKSDSAPLNVTSIDTPTPSNSGGSTSAGGGTGGGAGGGGGGAPSSSQNPSGAHVTIPGPTDHGIAGSSSSRPGSSTPNGSITFPTESTFGDQPTTSISTQVIVQADAAKTKSHGRPTGLAVVSILALAAVTGAYIYQYVGGVGALRGAAAGGGRNRRDDDPPHHRGPTPGPRANHLD